MSQETHAKTVYWPLNHMTIATARGSAVSLSNSLDIGIAAISDRPILTLMQHVHLLDDRPCITTTIPTIYISLSMPSSSPTTPLTHPPCNNPPTSGYLKSASRSKNPTHLLKNPPSPPSPPPPLPPPTHPPSPTTQKCLFALVIATFNLLFSFKNPTSPCSLLLTKQKATASFSRPWKPSTVPSSRPG